MSTLRVNTLQDATGSNQPAMVGAAKAWVNFKGTGTVAIRESFNVSSITDNGTGDYTANFINPMPDANYSVCGSASNNISTLIFATSTLATTTARFSTSTTTTLGDNEQISVAVFR